MGRKGVWVDKLARSADLLDEPIPGLPLIEIAGDRRVLIENHCGVIAYSPEQICVKVKYGQISVMGGCLELAKMDRGQLIISGTIRSVELHRGCC